MADPQKPDLTPKPQPKRRPGPTEGDRRRWNALVDELFEADEQNPYLGQTIDPDAEDET